MKRLPHYSVRYRPKHMFNKTKPSSRSDVELRKWCIEQTNTFPTIPAQLDAAQSMYDWVIKAK